MRPIACVADVHLGNHKRFGGVKVAGLNDRAHRALDVLEEAASASLAKGAQAFVVLGDLFDTDTPVPQLVTAAADIVSFLSRNSVRVVILKGNHDSASSTPGDHALGPLRWAGAEIIESPRLLSLAGVTAACVPFSPGSGLANLTSALTALQPPPGSLLFAHMGIVDQDTAPWLKDSVGAIRLENLQAAMQMHSMAACISGDWHIRKQWGNILQCGALVPTGFDNPGQVGYGTVAMWDGQLHVTELPGPRFIKAFGPSDRITHMLQTFGLVAANTYLDVECSADQVAACRQVLASLGLAGLEVSPDRQAAALFAQEAATAARSAPAIRDAVLQYIAASVPGATRVDVAARVMQYLNL
jgi:hypothetical protein